VSVTGELAIVKRVRTRARRHAISPRAAAAGSPIVRGKPLPRLPTYRTPAHAVITRVIWSGDFGPAGTTLTADAAGVVRPSFTFGDRTDIRRAARAGTGALITLELTATDDAGNKTTQTTEVRVTLR
jgi:hypothetical protein